jgi:hypothetical protein
MTPTSLFLLSTAIRGHDGQLRIPFKVSPQMTSCMEAAGFDREHCQAQPFSSFYDRKPMQFAQQSDDAQLLRKREIA